MPRSSLIRWAFEGSWASRVRSAVTEREAVREQRFVESLQNALGFEALNVEQVAGTIGPKREKFFILGSGASVEELGEEAFNDIRSATSVGINAWVLHSFVPDIYVYEPVPSTSSDHFKTLSFLDRPEVIEKKPLVFILRPRNSVEASQLQQIPPPLRTSTYIYGRVSPYTRRVSNLKDDLPRTLQFLEKMPGSFVALDSGATIVRMACLGIFLGFKKIVFVGVDLNNTDYFWQVNPAYLRDRGIESFDSEQKFEIHETELEGFAPFVASTIISALAEVARERFGVQFHVASSGSKLSSFLPLYHPPRT